MAFCRYCGNKIKPDIKFCNYCGKNLTPKKTQRKVVRTKPKPTRKTPAKKIQIDNEPNKQVLFDLKVKPKIERLIDKLDFLSNRQEYIKSDYTTLMHLIDELMELSSDKHFDTSNQKSEFKRALGIKLNVDLRILEYLTSNLIEEELEKVRGEWYEIKKTERRLDHDDSLETKLLGETQKLSQNLEVFIDLLSYSNKGKITQSILFANLPDLYTFYINDFEPLVLDYRELINQSSHTIEVKPLIERLNNLVNLLNPHEINHQEFSIRYLNKLISKSKDESEGLEISIERNLNRIKSRIAKLNPRYEKIKQQYVTYMASLVNSKTFNLIPRKADIKTIKEDLLIERAIVAVNPPQDIILQHDEVLAPLIQLDQLQNLSELQKIRDLPPLN